MIQSQNRIYIKYIKQNWILSILVLLSQATTAVCYTLLPNLFVNTVNAITTAQLGPDIIKILIILMLMTLFSVIKGFGTKYIKDTTIIKFRIDLANNFFAQRLIPRSLPNEYITHISNETNDIGTAVSEDLIGIASNGIISLAMFVMLLKLNFIASLFILGIVVIIGLVALWGTIFVKNCSDQVQDSQTMLLNKIRDYIVNYKVVLVFQLRQRMAEELKIIGKNIFKQLKKRDMIYSLILPIVNLVIYVLLISLFFAIFVIFHNISPKVIIAYIFYVVILVASFASFIDGLGKMQDHSGALQKINELLSSFQKETTGESTGFVLNNRQQLVGRNLGFSYEKNQWIFRHLDFEINAGDVVAIRGQSGAGKSTFLELMLKMLDPLEGEIYCGDIALHKLSRDILYKQIGVVFQEPFLFDTSIRENVDPDGKLSRQELTDVIKSAGISLEQFLNGVETRIGSNNTSISRGQAQRISLARALAKRPKILILDEVTASVDDENSKMIENTIKNLNHQVTIIFTSHDNDFLREILDCEIILG